MKPLSEPSPPKRVRLYLGNARAAFNVEKNYS